MTTKEYAMAYTEVLEVLRYVPDEDLFKIPKEKILFYELNRDADYEYRLDTNKRFKDQEMSRITKAILANIYRDYWAPLDEKKEIIMQEKRDIAIMEESKREDYNPDKMFNSRKKSEEYVKEDTSKNLPADAGKEGLFRRILNLIFRRD